MQTLIHSSRVISTFYLSFIKKISQFCQVFFFDFFFQEYCLRRTSGGTKQLKCDISLLMLDTMRSLALLLGVKAACILLVSSLSGTGAVNNSGRWWWVDHMLLLHAMMQPLGSQHPASESSRLALLLPWPHRIYARFFSFFFFFYWAIRAVATLEIMC